MPNTLYIVSCGANKRAVRSPAKDLYVGPLFRAAYVHACRFAQAEPDIRILSAKHGLLYQMEMVDPYEQKLEDLSPVQLGRLAASVRAELRPSTTLPLRIVMLAGNAYVDLFRRACVGTDWEKVPLRTPLAHLGRFQRRAWLYADNYPVYIDPAPARLSCLCESENERLDPAARAAATWWANQLIRDAPPPEASVFADALFKQIQRIFDETYSKTRGEWPEDISFPINFQNAPGGHLGAAFQAIGLNEAEWWKREFGDRHLDAYMTFAMDQVSVMVGGKKEDIIYQR